ncbi:CDP-diacylglycerol--serine O-phosphatidyltransferase [Prosthecochloris sp. HL-130-GSB]|uniref:CDP-diacylglycerol--serine O-phosphatidyltransferase n=1 Tax=Prosthecochloris aestuarii TaxID=1102 RepID=A0A831SNP2_PROAE|nr:CDP-diacylglycerol--serine O-phosphatidyltransferase [Prosthecochloris sp. HL-130-GSB]ARM31896.1 CDP-diacylglycerol--serine O-phosphatidyltransferase [Prosthecochloris sp. HL-130-GSB]MBO8092769.1 CDP-diacylglycerol--serine O-phosphatidyltransferase [Prosthecochloris sp.]HED31962.1 CDP-diacylglycerol--serine O-phosphatidyltransferase [Prosthecochloris aestuarii]
MSKHMSEHDNTRPARSRVFVPSVFTSLNMVCGYFAIVMAGSSHIVSAAWFIIIAALFDTLDGFVARLTNGSSEFGGALDSLSDLISFGAAPAYLVYCFGLSHLGAVGAGISSLLLLAGGLRLARFTIGDGGGKGRSFSGLPTPAQALALAGFVLWMHSDMLLTTTQLTVVLSWMIIVFSLLMISRVEYETFPKLSVESLREHPVRTGIFFLAVFCVLIFQAKAFFLAMLLYILLGVMRSLSLLVRQSVL